MRKNLHRHHDGTSTERPGLTKALAALASGDTLVVWKLDRLGRSLSHLVSLIAKLGGQGVSFRSLSDPIDTTSGGGRLIMHIMGALADDAESAVMRSDVVLTLV